MKSILKKALLGIAIVAVFNQCKKVEGPGGTSAIRGALVGVNFTSGESEIIEITVKSGSDLEHGDYWLFNSPSGENLYYVWYKNQNWVSNGNPFLQGRTGISVDFNYSDSNTEIANKTAEAISLALQGEYTMSLNQDIISLTSSSHSAITDADNGTTNFNVDISNQGKPDVTGEETAIADERVFLIYGEGTSFNETVRTGANGIFTFEGLQVGKYKAYALTENQVTGEKTPVYLSIEISKNGTITEIGQLTISH